MQTLEQLQENITKQLANAQQQAAYWQAQVYRYEGALATVSMQIKDTTDEKQRQTLGAQIRETLGNEITAYANASGASAVV